jgi:heme A synthase
MEKALKWIAIGIIVVIAIMIATGNMGGSRDATSNYGKVMRGE